MMIICVISGYQEENLAAGYGVQRLPDLKEMFCIGPYNPSAGMPAIRWPANPNHMRSAYLAYYQALELLAAKLLRMFALALKLPENFFDDKITRHRSALRVLNYPALQQMPPPGQIRAGEHTDYGSLTILLQDKVGGLQVRDKQMNWVDVAPVANSFVINIGDLMQRWTNDQFVSTLHRVVAPQSMARRQSMAFFHNIDRMINLFFCLLCHFHY
jgi:isopenicillin N synthase-like dioxygenase